MSDTLNALSLLQFHDTALGTAGWPLDGGRAPASGVWRWIHANHRHNSCLWHAEAKARRADIGVHELAASKRLIDAHNTARSEALDAIDDAILEQLASVAHGAAARMSSETPGAMIDRLSVLALRIVHMRSQAQRGDASPAYAQECARKLRRLVVQRRDLALCLDQLLRDARQGRAYFKVYLPSRPEHDAPFHAAAASPVP